MRGESLVLGGVLVAVFSVGCLGDDDSGADDDVQVFDAAVARDRSSGADAPVSIDAATSPDGAPLPDAGPQPVTLLFHLDESTGLDESCGPRSATATNDVSISTVQSQFGGASALVGGSNDFFEVDTGTDIDFGSEDFAIDFWVFPQNVAGNNVIIQSGADLSNRWYCQIFGGTVTWRWHVGGPLQVDLSSAAPVTNGQWYHYAVVRSGDTFTLYVDGQVAATATSAMAIPSYGGRLVLGTDQYLGGSSPFLGHIDEVRISTRRTRFDAPFTPPAAPHVCD